MAIFSHSTSFLVAMILVTAVGMMVPKVRGGACSQTIGLCSPECKNLCVSKFSGGDGGCDLTIGTPLCKCYYVCGPPLSPPKPKRCLTSLGNCSIRTCSQECCNQKCSDQYPGLDAQGTCDQLIGSVELLLCSCRYNC